MSTIAYRLTVYDTPLYGNSTVVLTPASGSSHSDPFQIATTQMSGYRPFMRIPRGQSGQFDLNKGASTVGSYRVDILDRRTGDDNLTRWCSAFIGDNDGLLKIVGRKALIEMFDGLVWSPFFVGRINSLDLSSPTIISLEIGDSLELLKQEIFRAKPRVDYAVYKSILPAGFINDLQIDGTSNRIAKVAPFTIAAVSAGTDSRTITLDNASINRSDNFYPQDAFELNGSTNVVIGSTTHGTEFGNAPLRAMVLKGGNYYHYAVDYLIRLESAKAPKNTVPPIARMRLIELPSNDADRSLLTSIDGSGVKQIWVYRLVDDSGEKLGTCFLSTDSPLTVLADVLDGKFFASSSMATAVPYNSASLVSLPPQSHVLYRLTEPTDAVSWIEKNVCLPFNVGYAVDAVVTGGVARSELRFFSTKQPTTLSGSVTIDGTDLVSDSDKEWQTEQPLLSVKGTYYMEKDLKINKATAGTTLSANTELTQQTSYVTQLLPSSNNAVDATYNTDTIDFSGLRGIDNNTENTRAPGGIYNISSFKYVQGQVRQYLSDYYQRRKSGAPSIRLTLGRNSKTSALRVGDYVISEVSVLPNPAIRQRGGQRVLQCIQKIADGLNFSVAFADAGLNATMAAPSLGTVTMPSIHQVSFSVTTTEDALVEIQYAAVESAGPVPSSSSRQWTLASVLRIGSTSDTVKLDGLPNGRRIFVRARCVSPVDGDIKMASAYVTSGGSELDGLTAPSSVAVDQINSRSARVRWVNNETNYSIEVWLASPAGIPDTIITTLPAGSTQFQLTGLHNNSSSSHRVGIRYRDEFLGFSAFGTADFSATGAAPTLDAPAAIFLYVGRI